MTLDELRVSIMADIERLREMGVLNLPRLPQGVVGTAFEIVKTAHGYASTPTTLFSFNGTNGEDPAAGLIADSHGNLFGTTELGGAYGLFDGLGTVFEIVKTAHGYASTPTTLVSFNGTDGSLPISSLIADSTTLVSFNGTDGSLPMSSLIADSHGNLFGTAFSGGANNDGTVFEIVKTAHGYASTPTTLVSFNGTDGSLPISSLIADSHGNLFGTTAGGGANDDGTVFEIAKTAHGYASTPTTLVSFNGTDGASPRGSLIADAHGNLFGTTIFGGANDDGTVFEIAKTAHGYASTPTTLVSFNGTDGASPRGSVIADAHGDLFGTTGGGGANNDGTVFEITDSGFSTHKTPSYSVVESHDSFLFAPNLGEQTTTKFNVHNNTIGAPQSEFTQFAELLSQVHQDAANLPHDASDPMHDAAMLSAQHAHHFLV